MRRSVSDAVISGGVLLILVGVLAAIDPRVREHVGALIGQSSPGTTRAASEQFGSLAFTMLVAVRDQSIEHAPMTIFVVAAMALFITMIRT